MANPFDQFDEVMEKNPFDQFSAPKTSIPTPAETFGMSLSGAVPFGGKITSGLAAGALSPFLAKEGEGLADAYSRLYQEGQAYQAAGEEENLVAALAGMGTGILATLPMASARALGSGAAATTGVRGAINAIPNTLSKIGDFVRGGQIAKDAGLGTRAAALALRAGKGAAVAAPTAGLYEMGVSETGDPIGDFSRGARLGAAFGAGAPVVGAASSAMGRAVMPKIDEGLRATAKLAQKYNIPLSIDQITSGRSIQTMQRVSQDFPFSGQAGFKDKQMSAFNKALLKTVGGEGDKITRKTMDDAFFRVGKKFDKFGKGKTFDVDILKQGLSEIVEDAPSYATTDAQKALGVNVKNILDNVADGQIAGEKLNQLRVKINRAARRAKDADTVDLLKDVENVIIETLAQGDEALIREAKNQYKNLIVLEPLAAKATGGNIPVTQLTNRVNRVYGRQFVRGRAGDIGELADIGRELLPEVGGSPTAQNLATMGALGSGVISPATIPGIVSAVAVNRAIQSGANRNQAIINAMTKDARNQILALPPPAAQKTLDDIAVRLGIGTTLGVSE